MILVGFPGGRPLCRRWSFNFACSNLGCARRSKEFARLERIRVALGAGTQATYRVGKVVLIEVDQTYAAMYLFPQIFGSLRGSRTCGVVGVHLEQSFVQLLPQRVCWFR